MSGKWSEVEGEGGKVPPDCDTESDPAISCARPDSAPHAPYKAMEFAFGKMPDCMDLGLVLQKVLQVLLDYIFLHFFFFIGLLVSFSPFRGKYVAEIHLIVFHTGKTDLSVFFFSLRFLDL